MNPPKISTVEAYLADFPSDVRTRMKQIRELVLELVPEAVESISYGMPAYKYKKKPLVYFGGFQHHIGLYPTPNGIEAFLEELKPYAHAKGSVKFPHDQPLPMELIRKIVLFRQQSINEKKS